jgi:hypothetical protein
MKNLNNLTTAELESLATHAGHAYSHLNQGIKSCIRN